MVKVYFLETSIFSYSRKNVLHFVCIKFIYKSIGLVGRVVRDIGVKFHVDSYQSLKKWYLIPPCLILSIIRYISRVKGNNSGKGITPSTTHLCSS